MVCALICNCQLWDLIWTGAFPNHVQLTEFAKAGLQSSRRNIRQVIRGSRMHLSPILSVIAKAVNAYIYVIFLFCIFNTFSRISNKLLHFVIMGYTWNMD